MYLFSGEDTCSKLIAALFVMSVNWTALDWLPAGTGEIRSSKQKMMESKSVALKRNCRKVVLRELPIRFVPLFLF